MKKIFLITVIALALTGCTNWESEALDAPHEIVYQDDNSAIIVYDNDYGIEFNDPDVNLPEDKTGFNDPKFSLPQDQEANHDLLFGHFFNKSSKTKQGYICLNETPPEKVPLVTWHSNCSGCHGASRTAYICEKQYVIIPFNLDNGPYFYGPYDLETHEFIELNIDSTKNPS